MSEWDREHVEHHLDVEDTKISTVKTLTYAGVIPFFLAVIVVLASSRPTSATSFAISFPYWISFYGAIILSFLGGIRWGAVMVVPGHLTAQEYSRQFAISVVPAIIGWIAVMPVGILPGGFTLGFAAPLGLLLISFLVMGVADFQAARSGYIFPRWYGGLRLRVTLYVSILLLVIMARYASWGI